MTNMFHVQLINYPETHPGYINLYCETVKSREQDYLFYEGKTLLLAVPFRNIAYVERLRMNDGCPACSGPIRETTGLICQTCGKDFNSPAESDS